MSLLPVLGPAPRPMAPSAAALPAGGGPGPAMHLVPGPYPVVLVVADSRLYEVSPEFFAELAEGDAGAMAELLGRGAGRRVAASFDEVAPPPSPTALSLNLAQVCNLACSYCYADEGRFHAPARPMPGAVAMAAIDRLVESAGGSRVTLGFIGGEPFLNRRALHASVAHARARAAEAGCPIGFSVTTNGTLLTAEDVELLRANAFVVTVSLDGDAATHDRHRAARGGGGSHARAMAALAPLLRDPGKARVAARATVTRDDLRVAERVTPLLEAGFLEVGVSPARTGPDPELLLRGADWERFLGEMIRAAEQELARLRAGGVAEPCRFSNLGIALKELHRGSCRPLPCGAAHGYVSLSADGRYYTCHRTINDPRFDLGDLATGPSLEARRRFLEVRHVDRQEPCRSCWARYLCGGGCHAEVAAAGRDGCDYVRGWLEHCMRTYVTVADELPHLLRTPGEGAP
jgi:uncharacterized protein